MGNQASFIWNLMTEEQVYEMGYNVVEKYNVL